jgi:hypothetical protein
MKWKLCRYNLDREDEDDELVFTFQQHIDTAFVRIAGIRQFMVM